MHWFGPSWGAPICREEDATAVPVGLPCHRCGELIADGDAGIIYSNGPAAHYACFIREIIGSVAHIERRCSCYDPGATEGDSPGLTKRQAAEAAVAAWEAGHRGLDSHA